MEEDFVKTYEYPKHEEWREIMTRATLEGENVHDIVKSILDNVQANGDAALCEYSSKFDATPLTAFAVSEKEIEESGDAISDDLKEALAIAKRNIKKFHEAQVMKPIEVKITDGIICEQREISINSVGLYIPGGNSPLFSTVLMLAIPASIAGCSNVILCTPPDKDGNVNPAILYAAKIAGVDQVFKIGGAQAIAAMAFGTATVPKVNKIFGPGNRFVTEAKKQISADGIPIDMPAGPSEVMIVADDKANLDFIATDFLSQAEHGPDSQSILLTTSKRVANNLPNVIRKHLDTLPRKDMILKSLSHSSIILLKTEAEIWKFANDYAPEHLIINCEDADEQAANVENAGSVFIGQYSPESAGDYASGTNHTLPTNGYAKGFNGVNLDSFMKKITFQRLSPNGIMAIGKAVETMAENEDLMAHKLAITVRLNEITSNEK